MKVVRKAMSSKLGTSVQRDAAKLATNLKAVLPQILDRTLQQESEQAELLAHDAVLHSDEGELVLAKSEMQSAADSLDRAHLQAHLEDAESSKAISGVNNFDLPLRPSALALAVAEETLRRERGGSNELASVLSEARMVTGRIARDLARTPVHAE